MDWCTIESDPGVFTELIHSLGCTDVQLEEVISLDSLPAETLGLVFLFKFKKELYANDTRHGISSEANRSVYFAKQTIQNACATVAARVPLSDWDGIEHGRCARKGRPVCSRDNGVEDRREKAQGKGGNC